MTIEEIKVIIKKIKEIHPYRVWGKHETYSSYNEGWVDACDIIEEELLKKTNRKTI